MGTQELPCFVRSKKSPAFLPQLTGSYCETGKNSDELTSECHFKGNKRRSTCSVPDLKATRQQARKRPTATSWRMDETYIRVKGKWTYLYRAVDRDGKTLDFLLSKRRDLSAARRFFKRAIGTNGVPDRIVIDKSGANLAGLQAVNVILKFTGNGRTITVRQVKYLNNILEQDHRFIKRITRPMMGFKAFHSAAATLAGIETAHMIRKGQIAANGATAFQTFAELAA